MREQWALVPLLSRMELTMAVIGVAGLPGSGKSRLMEELRAQGYVPFDEFNMDWDGNLAKLRAEVRQGKDAAVSDLIFCDEPWRENFEWDLGSPVQWVFFENNPWQCAKNCLYRFMFEDPNRPLQDMIIDITHLAGTYLPYGDIRPVARADKEIERQIRLYEKRTIRKRTKSEEPRIKKTAKPKVKTSAAKTRRAPRTARNKA